MCSRVCAVAAIAASLVATVLAQDVAAQAYPHKPIKLIVPTVPGPPPDVVARVIGDAMGRVLGQPVVVENRAGAIGTLGLATVARAAPDGYTLGLISMPYTVAPSLLPTVPYDTARDLAPITLLNHSYTVLVVPAASKWRTVGDLVAAARERPESVTCGSSGNATPGHLACALLAQASGARFLHVPFKGPQAATAAVMSVQVDLFFMPTGAAAVQSAAGKVRALATPAPERLAAFPDMPTLQEAGFSGVTISDWQGLVAPSGTPSDIIERVRAAAVDALRSDEVRKRFTALSLEPSPLGAQAFGSLIAHEIERWREVVKTTGMRVD